MMVLAHRPVRSVPLHPKIGAGRGVKVEVIRSVHALLSTTNTVLAMVTIGVSAACAAGRERVVRAVAAYEARHAKCCRCVKGEGLTL